MKRIAAFFKKEKETISRLHGKQRWNYIWDYYKIPIILVGSLIVIFTYAAIYNAGRGDTVLYTVMINSKIFPEGEEPGLFPDLLQADGYDIEKVHASIEQYMLYPEDMSTESASTVQALAAMFSIGDLDIFIADAELVRRYAANDAFENLEMYLPEEYLAKYDAEFYRTENSKGETKIFGILCDEDSALVKSGYYQTPVVLCIASQAEHLQLGLDIIELLLDGFGK